MTSDTKIIVKNLLNNEGGNQVDINKATNISLVAGRYDCCGNLFFTANGLIGLSGLTTRFGIAAQIEFLVTLQDSLNLTDDEIQHLISLLMRYIRDMFKERVDLSRQT